MKKLGLNPVRSSYSDPEAVLGPRHFIQIYEHPDRFTVLNVFSSSKIRREVIAEYAEQQKIIFEKLFNGQRLHEMICPLDGLQMI